MKIIGLYNIKGGVGKTAASVNLAYLSSMEGFRTLLIDLDPQGSASFYFKVRAKKKYRSKHFLRGGKPIGENIRGTDYAGLDSLPSHLSYGKMDIGLDRFKRSKIRLSKILKPLQREYDLIVLDCPPSISLVSENIFRAADMLLVPVIPTPLSMVAYNKLLGFFKTKTLDDSKIHAFFSMFEKRKKIHRELVMTVSEKDPHFLKSVIPYVSDVEKMGIFLDPVFRFRPNSPAAQSYESLWDEVKKIISSRAK